MSAVVSGSNFVDVAEAAGADLAFDDERLQFEAARAGIFQLKLFEFIESSPRLVQSIRLGRVTRACIIKLNFCTIQSESGSQPKILHAIAYLHYICKLKFAKAFLNKLAH